MAFVKFVFEAYEGIATMTTENAAEGRFFFVIPAGCEEDVETVLSDLRKEIWIEPVNPEQEESGTV